MVATVVVLAVLTVMACATAVAHAHAKLPSMLADLTAEHEGHRVKGADDDAA